MELLSTKEVADRLNVTTVTVGNWCRSGLLEGARKVGSEQRGTWVIPQSALEDFERPDIGRPSKVLAEDREVVDESR